jgi:hypothetical protein
MAKPGHKVRAIGAPFDTNYSSCSNITPTNFTWSSEKGDWDVHIDRGMMYQPDLSIPKEKRYGWVCESRFIVPDVYNFLIHNHKILFNNYYNKIFTCDQSLLELNSNFIFCPSGSNYPWVPKQDWAIYEKTKLCSMFCSPKLATEGHVYRHQIARLALDADLDVFGGAHGTQRTVTDPRNPWNTKLNGIKEYMFSIVIENGIYDSYWTEKITDCFATGTVPVYCGTKKIFDFFDPDGIIFLEQNKESEILQSLSKQVYDSKLTAITNNFNAVKDLKLADEYLFDKIIK